MQTLTFDQPGGSAAPGRLSWRAVAGALRGNALAAFPEEAFAEDVVVQRFLGRDHLLLQCPDAIRHVLIENPQNYRRSPPAIRVLRPMFGRGLFLSNGEEWRQQRRAVAPAFAPRTLHRIAGQVVSCAAALAADLAALDMLAAPDPETGLSPDPERLGDQVATIVVAGHETTAAAMFWACYLLARHPAGQERLAAEVCGIDLSPQMPLTLCRSWCGHGP